MWELGPTGKADAAEPGTLSDPLPLADTDAAAPQMAILGFPTAIMRDRYAVSALLAGRRRGIVLSLQASPQTVTGRADDTRGRGHHSHAGFDRGPRAARDTGAGVNLI